MLVAGGVEMCAEDWTRERLLKGSQSLSEEGVAESAGQEAYPVARNLRMARLRYLSLERGCSRAGEYLEARHERHWQRVGRERATVVALAVSWLWMLETSSAKSPIHIVIMSDP